MFLSACFSLRIYRHVLSLRFCVFSSVCQYRAMSISILMQSVPASSEGRSIGEQEQILCIKNRQATLDRSTRAHFVMKNQFVSRRTPRSTSLANVNRDSEKAHRRPAVARLGGASVQRISSRKPLRFFFENLWLELVKLFDAGGSLRGLSPLRTKLKL